MGYCGVPRRRQRLKATPNHIKKSYTGQELFSGIYFREGKAAAFIADLDNKVPGDLLALDIRRCLHYLGEITGEITNEDQLDYIFSKFCIGK